MHHSSRYCSGDQRSHVCDHWGLSGSNSQGEGGSFNSVATRHGGGCIPRTTKGARSSARGGVQGTLLQNSVPCRGYMGRRKRVESRNPPNSHIPTWSHPVTPNPTRSPHHPTPLLPQPNTTPTLPPPHPRLHPNPYPTQPQPYPSKVRRSPSRSGMVGVTLGQNPIVGSMELTTFNHRTSCSTDGSQVVLLLATEYLLLATCYLLLTYYSLLPRRSPSKCGCDRCRPLHE